MLTYLVKRMFEGETSDFRPQEYGAAGIPDVSWSCGRQYGHAANNDSFGY